MPYPATKILPINKLIFFHALIKVVPLADVRFHESHSVANCRSPLNIHSIFASSGLLCFNHLPVNLENHRVFKKLTPTLATRFLRLWSVLKRPSQRQSEFKYRSVLQRRRIIPQLKAVADAEARLNALPHALRFIYRWKGLTAIAMPLRRAVWCRPFGTATTARSNHSNLGGSGALKVGADFLKRYFPEQASGSAILPGKTT